MRDDLRTIMNEAAEEARRELRSEDRSVCGYDDWAPTDGGLVLPKEIRQKRRKPAVLIDGPMKGFDNAWFDADAEFPPHIVLASTAPTREAERVRLIRLDQLQTLNSHVNPEKRDFVTKEIEGKRPPTLHQYAFLRLDEDTGRPTYYYEGLWNSDILQKRRQKERSVEVE